MSAEVIFVSRSGRDAAIGETVARILQNAGFEVILQQWNFANTSFIAQMQGALEGGARVVALLSESYLASDYCAAEWQSVLADDPLNKRSGLIVLRVGECSPPGLLKALTYSDLVAVRDPQQFERIVVEAVNGRTGASPHGASPMPVTRGSDAHNLPTQFTAFVGRRAVRDDIAALIERARLVTLLGAGGIGKTRTALEVASETRHGWADGVWFVDFAPLQSAAFVVAEIASVLAVREERGASLLDCVLRHLATKRSLLILDNCEHVIAEARSAVEAILGAAAGVNVLVTSREPLAARGEAIYRFPTLGLPERLEGISASEALAYEAVALFVDRARTAEPRFSITDANAGTVAEICRRLDGIALAIELAAPRLKILSLAQLAAKLDERFRLLTGGSKTALPRQRTLRALIDWSYDLLDARERHMFRGLSIFAGGWTLAAATAVAGDDDDDEFTIVDRLTSLVDKSLVSVDFSETEQRFYFLESTRAYARESAREHGEHEPLARRRAEYFATLVGDGANVMLADDARYTSIEADLENFRGAMGWGIDESNDAGLGGRIAYALGRFWSMRHPGEGLRWLTSAQRALADGGDRELLARLASAIAAMLPHGSFERFEATERALEACRSAASSALLTRALAAFGEQLVPLDRSTEARSAFEEALRLARECRSDMDAARALAGLGSLALDRGEIVVARAVYDEALGLFEKLGSVDGIAYVRIALSLVAFRDDDVELAIEHATRGRLEHGKLGNNWSSACAANYLSAFSLAREEPVAARAHARDALELLRDERHPLYFAEAVAQLGLVSTLEGDAERGARLLGYAESAYHKLAHRRDAASQRYHDRHVRLLVETFGARRFAELTQHGAGLDDAFALSLALAV